jgi:hypothetical protein
MEVHTHPRLYDPTGGFQMASTRGTRSPHRGFGTRAIYLAIAITLLLMILALPALFLLTGRFSDSLVARLGNIGQAYGAISALLSALALIAVGASIAYQARQDRGQRIDSLNRAFSSNLEFLLQDVETYGPCIIDPAEFESPQRMRQYFFTSMWLQNLRTMYDLGLWTEAGLRSEPIQDMTRSPLAREFWEKRRGYLKLQSGEFTDFNKIVDDEFRKAQLKEASDTRGVGANPIVDSGEVGNAIEG